MCQTVKQERGVLLPFFFACNSDSDWSAAKNLTQFYFEIIGNIPKFTKNIELVVVI
jgi:hypothetical protein